MLTIPFGILSIFQITFIPGLVLLELLKINVSFVKKTIFSFGLSLILNYLLVLLLASLKIYNQKSLLIIILIESLVIFFIKKKEFVNLIKASFLERLENSFKETLSKIIFLRNSIKTGKSLETLSVLLSIICILFMLALILKNTTTTNVFKLWDAIVSWNKWALEWASNRFPSETFNYPQVIPANWSISYVLTKTSLQVFPKFIIPFFTFYLLLLMFVLGTEKKSTGYYWGIIATFLILKNAMGKQINAGLADMPVAFMVFLSISCLLFATENNQKRILKTIYF